MEPEVIEISPPWKLKANARKRKEVAYHEIIDLDMDEDRNDVVLIQETKKVKGAISLGPGNAEQGSMHSAQTRKQVDLNNKGKDVSVTGGVMGQNSKSFIDLDDYDFEDDDYCMALQLQSQFDNMDIPTTGIKADNFQMKNNSSTCSGLHANNSSKKNPSLTGSCSSMGKVVGIEDVLVRYESFKRFDIVVDYSDHNYVTRINPLAAPRRSRFTPPPLLLPFFQPTKNWVKRIQYEWRILEENLPDTIFVRAYESRMDLLRAVIIGAEGTPYHDGLFFFDLCFTNTYPDTPPGLVLTAKSYFNLGLEYNDWKNRVSDFLEQLSIQYDQVAFIASLETMASTMEKPPKHFEDFVRGHFRKRARDIFMACKAYTQGVQVGCLVRGGVQDLDEEANYNYSWSDSSKANLVACLKKLVAAFNQIGAKEADLFSWLSEKKFKQNGAKEVDLFSWLSGMKFKQVGAKENMFRWLSEKKICP